MVHFLQTTGEYVCQIKSIHVLLGPIGNLVVKKQTSYILTVKETPLPSAFEAKLNYIY